MKQKMFNLNKVEIFLSAQKILWLWLVFILLSCIHSAAFAEEIKEPSYDEQRKNFWGFRIQGTRYALYSDQGLNLSGNSPDVKISYGKIYEKFFLFGSVDFLLGPYASNYKDQISIDYFGTGLSLDLYFNSGNSNIRNLEDSYGFCLGLQYADLYGKSTERLKSAGQAKEGSPLLSHQMRVIALLAKPGIFFAWFEKPRPRGNDPSLLATRVEAWVINFSFGLPLYAEFQSQNNVWVSNSETKRIKNSGRLYGHVLELGVTALLGI